MIIEVAKHCWSVEAPDSPIDPTESSRRRLTIHGHRRILSDSSKFFAAVLAVFLMVSVLAGFSHAQQSDSNESERIEITGTTMGPIPYRVVVIKDEQSADKDTIGKAVQVKLDHVNDLMSTYKSDSDISRFNQSNSTDWIEVHTDTARVVAKAIEISRATDGAFDVTVGPAVDLWHFGPNKDKKFTIPDDAEIEVVKAMVGWEKLQARANSPGLRKSVPSVQIDLSAIAKGFAVDEVVADLVKLNCNNVLVEVGGEVHARGKAGLNKRWRVGVEKPQEGFAREIEEVAELENAAMATSGDYRNFNVVDGKRFSHSIDPTTCRPAENDLATACIVADDCMTADAYATAVMVLGPDKGWALCQRLKLPILMMERSTRDPLNSVNFKKRMSADFPVASEPTQAKPKAGIIPVFISAAIVFALAILGMAAGAIFSNKQLQGSCGGLANMNSKAGDASCSLCQNPSSDCVETTG